VTTLPTFHLNGTSPESIRDEYHEVYKALREVEELFRKATCHPRDFYVQESGAWEKAREERNKVGLMLAEVSSYVEDWLTHSSENCRDRKSRAPR